MELEIVVHEDHKYIEFLTEGFLDAEASMCMAKSISESMRRYRIKRAIIDHRKITGVSGMVIDIYKRPKYFKIIGMILGIKIAEVIRPEHLEHFRFFETVCKNRGFQFSIFHEEQDALKWLLG